MYCRQKLSIPSEDFVRGLPIPSDRVAPQNKWDLYATLEESKIQSY
jgi:hypothetical protein